MAHAWKACWGNTLGGSNPPSSAVGRACDLRLRGERALRRWRSRCVRDRVVCSSGCSCPTWQVARHTSADSCATSDANPWLKQSPLRQCGVQSPARAGRRPRAGRGGTPGRRPRYVASASSRCGLAPRVASRRGSASTATATTYQHGENRDDHGRQHRDQHTRARTHDSHLDSSLPGADPTGMLAPPRPRHRASPTSHRCQPRCRSTDDISRVAGRT